MKTLIMLKIFRIMGFLGLKGVLKKFTSGMTQKFNERISKTELPPELENWIKKYKEVGERKDYIWQWLYGMFQVANFPIALPKYQDSLLNIKVLLTMFVCQLDDVADKKQDWNFLKELLKIPLEQQYIELNRLDSQEIKYLNFTKDLWNYIEEQIKKYPRYGELEEIFRFDIAQVLNEMKYSCLLNKNPYLLNKTECWQFMPYNMVAFVYSDLDLMSSLVFDFSKIGRIREIIFEMQKMARIGNWVSTWEREVNENDFASGIFVYAINDGVLKFEDLNQKNKLEIIKKIKGAGIEEQFLKEWERCYYKIKKIGKIINEENLINKFLSKLEKLIIFHLSSSGYK